MIRAKKTALLLALLMILSLAGCGRSGASAGVYHCVAAETNGVRFDPVQLYPGGASIELGSGGRGIVRLGEESGTIRWSLSGSALTVYMDDIRMNGTLSQGVLMLAMPEGGLTLTFVLEGLRYAFQTEGEPDEETLAWWCGDWYGRWTISNSKGQFADTWYDCCASVVYEPQDKHLLMTMWDEDTSKDTPMAIVELSLGRGGSRVGAAVSATGNFWFDSLEPGEWRIEPAASPYPQMLTITGHHSSEQENFDYQIILRPWGVLWDDVAAQDNFALPFRYEWYLEQIKSGIGMPDKLPEAL